MCVLSQAVRAGCGSSAGLFHALSLAQRNLFACVDFSKQAVVVVGSIAGAGDDVVQHDVRRLSDVWPHILALAGEALRPLPGARIDESAPMVRTDKFAQKGPGEEATVGEPEREAFAAALTLTCRALRDYLADLRVALKCKDIARGLFQGQQFAQALSFYKLAQWHCPQADSTLYSNAALCFSRLARHHAAVDSAITALLVEETNAKAAHALVKAELALGYTSCNGWQDDLIEHLSHTNKALGDVRGKHKQLHAPMKQELMRELAAAQRSSQVDARLLQLIAEEEVGENGNADERRRFLSAAIVQGAENATLHLVELEGTPRTEAHTVLALLCQAPLTVSMDAALTLGKMYNDKNVEKFLLYVSVAAASQEPSVLFDAGDTLMKHILSRSSGKWNAASCYSAWLMACGGQGERITELLAPAPADCSLSFPER